MTIGLVRKAELRRMAYDEAAALVQYSDSDLDDSLTEEEEDFVRETMRGEVVEKLRSKGKKR